MRPIYFLVATATLWPALASAMPLPDCAGSVEIARAHVVRVEKNGALVLKDGRAALLEGIRLPGADRPSDPITSAALDALRELAMKAPLTLTSTPPKEDRYGRIRVQAFGTCLAANRTAEAWTGASVHRARPAGMCAGFL